MPDIFGSVVSSIVQDENWLPVEGHAGYEVSNLGRVRKTTVFRLLGTRVKILKPHPDSGGYPIINLHGRDARGEVVRFTKSLHSLVAAAFIEGFAPGLELSHEDNDVSNAKADNLKWRTPSQNQRLSVGRPRKFWLPSEIAAMKAMKAEGLSLGSICAKFPGLQSFYLSRILSGKRRVRG